MEDRFQLRVQFPLDDHLGDAIPYRRYPERPSSPVRLPDVHPLHRRRNMASRRHPVPDLVQIILKVVFERPQRHLIDPTATLYCPRPILWLDVVAGQAAWSVCPVRQDGLWPTIFAGRVCDPPTSWTVDLRWQHGRDQDGKGTHRSPSRGCGVGRGTPKSSQATSRPTVYSLEHHVPQRWRPHS